MQAPARSEAIHLRLYDFTKSALIKIFANPYAIVCDLYCGGTGEDIEKWEVAAINNYVGIDLKSSKINEIKESWESQRKAHYTVEFFEADPCSEEFQSQLKEKHNQADLVCCLQNLQSCFEAEESARKLLENVSFLLKPGGYFFGITPDSSTIWAKYQKNVEAYHNRSGSLKYNIVPNCIRSENYMITFETEEEKFPLFGKKYQLKFPHESLIETHCLVHFPSFLRLAREAGLDYVEIQNLTEFYDDYRMHFPSSITNNIQNLLDLKGRLLPRSYDVLGLYSTFVFRKPNPDIVPPVSSPFNKDGLNDNEESGWQVHDDIEVPLGLGKISEQKGILGPGPENLRFPEALF